MDKQSKKRLTITILIILGIIGIFYCHVFLLDLFFRIYKNEHMVKLKFIYINFLQTTSNISIFVALFALQGNDYVLLGSVAFLYIWYQVTDMDIR